MIVTINTGSGTVCTELDPGQTLLDAVNAAGISGFDAACGGKGTCGKCRVLVHSGASPAEPEVQLACQFFPEGDIEITIPNHGDKAVIQSAFEGDIDRGVIEDESIYRRIYAELPPPSIEDQRADCERLTGYLRDLGHIDGLEIPLPLRSTLSGLMRENDFRLTAFLFGEKCVQVAGGDRSGDYYAAAVDIGTTTVVAYLVALAGGRCGEVLDYVSGLNSQKGFGGDVVSRIEYCMQAPGNRDKLSKRIRKQISSMVNELSVRNGIGTEGIGLITVAGNTTMTHLFAGFDPEGIAAAPFIPVYNGLLTGAATDFGLQLPAESCCAVLPGIASYVGSDITAGIISTRMHKSDKLSLLIDIGTNGEIVLGSRQGMTACSTAAGPALEGANISCGMGGVPGAVNSINAEGFSVIGDTEPRGICGSGIVDAVAMFIEAGLIDETGRILSEQELLENGVGQNWINCLLQDENGVSMRIAEGISLTQKDIREVQTAKAAIAAGIKTLLTETGKSVSDVERLYIAGGFGAAMNSRSAALIGLIPPELEAVVVTAGNTAGKGAVLASLSKSVIREAEDVAASVRYIELSTSALFQQEYMTAMYF